MAALRCAWWQTVRAGDLTAAAKAERTQDVSIPSRRGAIYDRNGVVMAQSVNMTKISCDPTVVQSDKISEMADALYEIFGGSRAQYVEMLTRSNTRDVTLFAAAEPSAARRLRERGYPGLYYRDVYQRVYPLDDVGCNVIGALRDDGIPAGGLETQYDDVLAGVDGHRTRELGLEGESIVGGQDDYTEAVDGKDVRISIDVNIQRVVQDTLVSTVSDWNAIEACCVVMDPTTGEIFACASTPTFDPNHLENLSDVGALSLKSVTSAYEPGSVMKPLTMSMAIDLGIATPDTSYYTPAEIQVGDDMVHDADERDYDTMMTLTEMLVQSSNVGTVLVAQDVGAQNFSHYTELYGLGHATGIDYPYENVPHVKTYAEYDGAWEAMAFGQSISISPLALTRAISAIANKGVIVNPHFLLAVNDEPLSYGSGSQVISEATASQVAWMMNEVVIDGYGKTGAIEGYDLSVKTGTAQRYDATTGTYATDSYTVSYVGFAPTSDPKVCVYMLVDGADESHEGFAVGSPWATIMQEALTELNIPPSSSTSTATTEEAAE